MELLRYVVFVIMDGRRFNLRQFQDQKEAIYFTETNNKLAKEKNNGKEYDWEEIYFQINDKAY